MRHFLFAAIAALAFTAQAQALTFKSGEVLGSDGRMYEGASPEQLERILAKARESGDAGGIAGSNVFVVVGENVTFIPITKLRGLPKEAQISIVGDSVIQQLTNNEDITYAQVAALSEIAAKSGISVKEILNDGDAASLKPEIKKEIEAASLETGISVDSLMDVNEVLKTMPETEVAALITDIDRLIDEGMAEQVDAFLTDLQEVEGAMDALTQFDSYDSCVSGGGGDVCDQIEAAAENQGM